MLINRLQWHIIVQQTPTSLPSDGDFGLVLATPSQHRGVRRISLMDAGGKLILSQQLFATD